jgi:ParB-like chromosome segregation protein Spo0J
MKIENVKPDSLNPAAYNPRREMTVREMDALRASIREYGFVEPIVVQKEGRVVVGGHQRLKAAIAEGMKTVPAVILNVTDRRAKVLNLALNKIRSDFTLDGLMAVLSELEEQDKTLAGFDEDDLEELAAAFNEKALAEEIGADREPILHYDLIFETEEEQQAYFKFMAHVRKRYKAATFSASLATFIRELLPNV